MGVEPFNVAINLGTSKSGEHDHTSVKFYIAQSYDCRLNVEDESIKSVA